MNFTDFPADCGFNFILYLIPVTLRFFKRQKVHVHFYFLHGNNAPQ